MEPVSNKKTIAIVDELILLLQDNNEKRWSKVLESIANDYKLQSSNKEFNKLFINIMRGGMGSFLDLILHQNGKPLIEENNKLDILRHQLYDECMSNLSN